MRTVKFKGYSKSKKGFVCGDLRIINTTDSKKYYIFKDNRHAIDVEPDSIGQFIGIFDKNGTEIYEGDIVFYKHKIGNTQLDYKNKYYVVYRKENFDFIFTERIDDYKFINRYAMSETKNIEIIGNIYEEKQRREQNNL